MMTAMSLPSRSKRPPPAISCVQATLESSSSTGCPSHSVGAIPRKCAGVKRSSRSWRHSPMVHAPGSSSAACRRSTTANPSTSDIRTAAMGRCGPAALTATPTSPVGVDSVGGVRKSPLRACRQYETGFPDETTPPQAGEPNDMSVSIACDGAEILPHAVQRSPLDEACEATQLGLRGSGDRFVGRDRLGTEQAPDDQDRRGCEGERHDVPPVDLIHKVVWSLGSEGVGNIRDGLARSRQLVPQG